MRCDEYCTDQTHGPTFERGAKESQYLPKSTEVLSGLGNCLSKKAHDDASSIGVADLYVKEDLAGDLLKVPE